METFRGHRIYFDGKEYRYSDSHLSTKQNWQNRGCGYCGTKDTPEGHDGCLGTLPEVMNACCGHGIERDAYIQYWNGKYIRGAKAIEEQKRLKNG